MDKPWIDNVHVVIFVPWKRSSEGVQMPGMDTQIRHDSAVFRPGSGPVDRNENLRQLGKSAPEVLEQERQHTSELPFLPSSISSTYPPRRTTRNEDSELRVNLPLIRHAEVFQTAVQLNYDWAAVGRQLDMDPFECRRLFKEYQTRAPSSSPLPPPRLPHLEVPFALSPSLPNRYTPPPPLRSPSPLSLVSADSADELALDMRSLNASGDSVSQSLLASALLDLEATDRESPLTPPYTTNKQTNYPPDTTDSEISPPLNQQRL